MNGALVLALLLVGADPVAPAAAADPPSPRTTQPPPAGGTAVAQAAPAPSAPAPAAVALAPGDGRRFSVRYRSSSNVYLEGGRSQGLTVGDRLKLLREKEVLAEVEVVFVAEQSASCRVLSEQRPIKPGDTLVRTASAKSEPAPAAVAQPTAAPAAPPGSPTPAAEAATTTSQPAPAPSAAPETPPRTPTQVRGSIAFGYYHSTDNTPSGLDYNERTARVDVTVSDIASQPLSFTLRGRSRQDVRVRSLSESVPQSERSDRIYEASLRYQPASDRFSLEAGRIGLYRFVGIGNLDGALARFRLTDALQLGAFGGRTAEVEGLDFNGSGAKFGGFLRLAPGGRYASRGYDVQLAFVRENAEGELSRQYLSLESRFAGGGRWSLFERAELDLNTGWRQEVTGKSSQLSNVTVSANLRLASSAWLFATYDGRRNYRYYRNRMVPEEVFDDLLHQGLRAGVNLARPGGFGATASFGMSLKEPDPLHPELNVANAYSASGGVRHGNAFGWLSLGLDGSAFSNGYAKGGLLNARIGHLFQGGHLLDLSYGGSFYRVTELEQDRRTQWLRLSGRAELVRHVYLMGDLEYDQGDDLKGPRALLEAGWIF